MAMIPGVGTLAALPNDVIAALRTVPRLDQHMRTMVDALRGVLDDTRALPELRNLMGDVARATSPLPKLADDAGVLPRMDNRMATIEAAMPTLVEVQQHLAQLPETMQELTEVLGRLLQSMTRLEGNVAALHGSLEPLGGIADRVPFRNRRG